MRPLTIRHRAVAIPQRLAALHPVLARIYAARGVDDPGHVEYRLASLAPPQALGGIDAACALLAHAIAEDRRICVVGDFDCDGATGTAVAVRGLRLLGARRVEYRVPNRFVHGYGLTPALVETFVDPPPDLIVTVDNGIASLAGVALARARGIRVLVTDHHLPGERLPDADAIVNPNLPGDAFPSKALAGVGVVFYLLIALRAHLRASGGVAGARGGEADLSGLLDLVALGTVADLVPLDYNNRLLVDAGLRRLRAGRGCAGVFALLESAGRSAAMLVPADLGFAVAPRVNAAGRLDDMGLGIECLLTDDAAAARQMAARLTAINAERRDVQAGMLEEGEALVERWIDAHGHDGLPLGLTLFEDHWHAGVVGLVASKLKDRLHRPVVACAPVQAGSEEVRGSARSIRGVHVRDLLAEVDARHPGLIERFGGHAMAAGLSLARGHVARFAAAFDAIVRERASPELFEPVALSDGELGPHEFTAELAALLRYAGPWGQGFAEPAFDGEFAVAAWRVVAERHLGLSLRLHGRAEPLNAIHFQGWNGQPPPGRVRALYRLVPDDYRGGEAIQLVVEHLQPA
ncbi:single-stranded-DNA-specific exonuclease RecJ [Dokdonella sp.]|uniref:single-stranded-DNA-specific exonuclease RecJ n=1 Tax=Dokdonella sp. TaxID=2291710 RepID=UPI0039C88916